MQEERIKIADEIRRIEEQKNQSRETDFQLQLKEKEKQLEDQRKLIEEMKRKADQGSMQLQGEVQELALEKLLTGSISRLIWLNPSPKEFVARTVHLTIRNSSGQECGKIIYESKRTKNFEADWIDKLKSRYAPARRAGCHPGYAGHAQGYDHASEKKTEYGFVIFQKSKR